jgi:hypothetical protein
MTVFITLTTAGPDSGPFNLYSDIDGFVTPFEVGVPKVNLEAGYSSGLVPDFTSVVRVLSTAQYCVNYVDITLGFPPTTTTSTSSTTTTSSSTTTTTTTTAITIPIGNSIGFPGPDTCTSLTITSGFTDGGGTLTQRGICYNTTGNPTIADSIFIGPTVTGISNVNVTGLTPSTTYYFRAYAINEMGVGYFPTVLANPTGFMITTVSCPTTTTTTTL